MRSVGGTYVYKLAEYAESVKDIPGVIVECGSYRLGSAIALAEACPEKWVFACDTFNGMPSPSEIDGHKKGDFGDADWQELVQVANRLGNIQLMRGDFKDTLGWFQKAQIALIYIDCDLYESARIAIEALWPRLVAGGLLVAHDYTNPACRGIKKVMDDHFGGKIAFDDAGFSTVRK